MNVPAPAPVPVAVVDTTIHVSAVGSGNADSPNREVIHRGVSGHFSMALSPLLRREIARKLIDIFALSAELVGRYIAQLDTAARIFHDAELDGSVSDVSRNCPE
jgi:hypothetical protein